MAAPGINLTSSSKTIPQTANAKSQTSSKTSQKKPLNITLSPKITPELSPKDKAFIEELNSLFPNLFFKPSDRFHFHPPKTIFLGQPQPFFALLTLHELGHALSGRWNYNTHVERLNIESRAWQRAKSLCSEHPEWIKKYNLTWDEAAENFAQDSLDTYRDWLHAKSKCKTCGLTRAQTPDGKYYCPLCDLL